MLFGKSTNIEEKVFLFVMNNPGIRFEKVLSEMKQFLPNDEDKKIRKKVASAIKELEKKQLITPHVSQDWQLNQISSWYAVQTEESNVYYQQLLEKYG